MCRGSEDTADTDDTDEEERYADITETEYADRDGEDEKYPGAERTGRPDTEE